MYKCAVTQNRGDTNYAHDFPTRSYVRAAHRIRPAKIRDNSGIDEEEE